MTNVAALASTGAEPGRIVHFWCPACEDVHGVTVDTPSGWTWNGDLDSSAPGEPIVCHSFVRDGRIR